MLAAPGVSDAAAISQPQTAEHYNIGFVWLICIVAALGGLLFGYDWVVIGGAKPFYEPYFHISSQALSGWANSCALLGCLLGSLLCGVLSDRYGRKKLLILAASLFTVSSICTGLAANFSAFVTWRIIGGIAIGIASNASPTYIGEISPAAWRGRLVTMNQLTIVIGVLGAQIVNWLIARPVPAEATAEIIRQSWNGQWGWRWMFIAVAVPSVMFFIGALFIPESPRWLAKRGDHERARAVLGRIGGDAYGTKALDEIQAALGAESEVGTAWRELSHPAILAIVATGVGLAVLQQWSGINVLFSYAEEIYRSAGYSLNAVLFNIVTTGAVSLVFTLIALLWVDRFGRRALMLSGCAGIGIFHIILGFAYAAGVHGLPVLVLTLCSIGCYGLSLAPVTWVLISELFPNRIRGLAVSICVSALWIACFLLTFTFPLLYKAAGPAGAFWIYGAICLAGFLFILLRLPETKGKTLEQIELEILEGK